MVDDGTTISQKIESVASREQNSPLETKILLEIVRLSVLLKGEIAQALSLFHFFPTSLCLMCPGCELVTGLFCNNRYFFVYQHGYMTDNTEKINKLIIT